MHLMLDLETLSTENNAVITQIGWVLFNPADDFLPYGQHTSGCFWPDPAEQIQDGRHISFATIRWWMGQSEEARAKFKEQTNHPSDVARAFCACFNWAEIEGVWGHGATFDPVVLGSFLQQYNSIIPWKYNQVRDTRTLFWLLPTEMEKATIKHSGEADAIAQALTVQKAFKQFNLAYNAY